MASVTPSSQPQQQPSPHPSAKPQGGKVAVMCGLGVVLAAVVVRMSAGTPADAVASAPAPSGSAASAASADVRRTPPPRRVRVDWPVVARRDPFRSDLVLPPPPPPPLPPAKFEPKPEPEVVAPPPPDRAALAREAAGKVKVAATMLGDAPQAMINGRLYRVGDEVAGYRIARIAARQVAVQREGFTFVLNVE